MATIPAVRRLPPIHEKRILILRFSSIFSHSSSRGQPVDSARLAGRQREQPGENFESGQGAVGGDVETARPSGAASFANAKRSSRADTGFAETRRDRPQSGCA